MHYKLMGAEVIYLERTMRAKVEELSRFFPCVLVTGARQVGKSTLLKEMMPEGMRYISLDDYLEADRARKDPIGFLEQYGEPLCIDEVQYAPELFRAIKMRVDANRRPGMYWLTGSQRFHLMSGVSESLAGRIGIVELFSLSRQESCGLGLGVPAFDPERVSDMVCSGTLCNIHDLYTGIWRGGYPQMAQQTALPRDAFFDAYVQTYVERDVQALSQVGNRSAFVRLMRSAALRTGQQLVYSDLARDAEVSPKTAAAWVSILETSGIVTLLEPYHVNSTKRLAKTPKLYFMDTGLCSWLAGWQNPDMMMQSTYAGAILETWVFGQLMRRFANAGIRPRISYFRNLDGGEVDFLLEQNGRIYPMEVKRSSSPSSADLKWARSIPPGQALLMPGIVFCTAERFVPMADGACGFPISAL